MEEEKDGREGWSVEKGGLRIDTVHSEQHEILNERGPNTWRGEENGGTDKDKYLCFVCLYMCVSVRALNMLVFLLTEEDEKQEEGLEI